MMKFPQLVTKLVTHCDAWIIGSAADMKNDNPRDYDVFVPISKWSMACSLVPNESKLNRLGGFKCESEGCKVDVFTCNMEELFATAYFKYAWHPKTGIRISKI